MGNFLFFGLSCVVCFLYRNYSNDKRALRHEEKFMIDWIVNRCRVTGKEEAIKEFIAASFSRQSNNKELLIFDFNKIYPMPTSLLAKPMQNPRKEFLVVLLALNGVEHFLERGVGNRTAPDYANALNPQAYVDPISQVFQHRKDVATFLRGFSRKTGISKYPLSPDAFAAIVRMMQSHLGINMEKVIESVKMMFRRRVLQEIPGATLSEGASLKDVAQLWMSLPGSKQRMADTAFYLHTVAETGCDSSYAWAMKHWGTGWPASVADILHRENGVLDFSFKTAWSFPNQIFKKLGEFFPGVDIWAACLGEQNALAGWGYFMNSEKNTPGESFSFYNGEEALNKAHLHIFNEARKEIKDEALQTNAFG